MRRGFALLGLAVAVAVAAVAAMFAGHGPSSASASSHSEAPLISQDPRADNTDLYAFVSPEDTSKVTIIANYIPLESPASGPNFPSFDDSVLYEIKIDNNGDGRDDLSYQFRFTTTTRNPDTFLYNTGPISSLNDLNWNRPQSYTVSLVTFKKNGHADKPVEIGTGMTPPDNIGPRSTPNYDALAASAVTTFGNGMKVFAGQRKDPFYVDLGSIFDLAGLRPFNSLHLIPLATAPGVDSLAKSNVHSIAIQVPITDLVKIPNTNIGIYASASRQKKTIVNEDGTNSGQGDFVQVSRLGNPLINEVLIPLGQKDLWNRSEPENDATFDNRYTTSELAGLQNLLYGSALMPVQTTGRTDLSLLFLTGVPGLNLTGNTHADLLRLNTSIKPGINGACPGGTASAAAPDRLAVLDADLCGFPNGRRLEDDVVDIDLRGVGQGYGTFLQGAFGLPNKSPNNQLGDGVDTSSVPYTHTFPYEASPLQGYQVP